MIDSDSQSRCADSDCLLHLTEESSDCTVIAFTGQALAFGGVPVFEFFKLMSSLRVNKIFLADRKIAWYQNGLSGIGEDLWAVADFLNKECIRTRATRVITIGASAGGFAAILFGILIKADVIHAFSPKTRLLDEEDFRNPSGLYALREKVGTGKHLLDLRQLTDRMESNSRIFIHYPELDPIDVRHARHMFGLPDVELIGYPDAEHSLAKTLKNLGMLKPLIISAVEGNHQEMNSVIEQSRSMLNERKRIGKNSACSAVSTTLSKLLSFKRYGYRLTRPSS